MASLPDQDYIHPDIHEPLAPTLTRPANQSPIPAATNPSTTPLRVAVVGGGIGGLSLALGLLRYSHLDVQVYEGAHKFGEIGAGIGVGPNAEKAIELLGPDIHLAFLRQATRARFRFAVGTLGSEKLITPRDSEVLQTTLHRAHYLDELVALMPKDRSHFAKRLVRLDDNTASGGCLVLHFKDDTTAEADVVIGADGVHSPTRAFVLGDQASPDLEPTYSGVVAYRNLVPMKTALAALGTDMATTSHIWIIDGALVMAYPVDHFQTLNVICYTWKFKTWDHKEWVIPATSEEILASYDGKLSKRLEQLVNLFDRPSAWSLWDLPSLPTYSRSRVTLLGDAAHATTPFQGQGAGQAIEDGLTLTALFAHIKTLEDVAPAFEAYDRVRRPRGNRVVTTSRQSGMIMSLQDGDYKGDAERAARSWPERIAWVYGRDMQGQCGEAVELFGELRGKVQGV